MPDQGARWFDLRDEPIALCCHEVRRKRKKLQVGSPGVFLGGLCVAILSIWPGMNHRRASS